MILKHVFKTCVKAAVMCVSTEINYFENYLKKLPEICLVNFYQPGLLIVEIFIYTYKRVVWPCVKEGD